MNASLDNQTRRAYWTAQMDAADAFMRRILRWPVAECGEPMESLVEACRAAGVEAAFSQRPHAAGRPRAFFLRRGLMPSFLSAARDMNGCGWMLKVEDGYRSVEMQRDLGLEPRVFAAVLERVRWECGGNDPPEDLLRRRLGALVAACPKTGTHMSGSAVDISVLRRDSGDEVDRGKPYLEMSECTPMDSPCVSAAARENRRRITAIMARNGFVAYPWEFWHYSAKDACAEALNGTGRPGRYGPVHMNPADGSVRAVENPTAPLVPEEMIVRLMEDFNGK